jgi:hypothetical protein
MLTRRNYAAIALAALISGVLSASLFGAVLGAAMGLAIWHFRTWIPANDTRLTGSELGFAVSLVTINFGALVYKHHFPILKLFTNAFVGGFMSVIVVGICIWMFGQRCS